MGMIVFGTVGIMAILALVGVSLFSLYEDYTTNKNSRMFF